jgi:HTH-type transcriptional regulator/antitoxin HipB
VDSPLTFAEQLTPHLRALRRVRGITQTQLGEQLGLSQSRIADIETNPGVVGLEQILQVLNTLGARLILQTETELCTRSDERVDTPTGTW